MAEIAAAQAYATLSYYNYVICFHKNKIKNTRKPYKKRRWWMTSVNGSRTKEGMDNMFIEMLREPSGEFDNFCRMSSSDFENILGKISPLIEKKNTRFRDAIPPKVRLALTLRFLASGDSYQSLHYLFKVSPQIISRIVPEVCAAINEVLKEEVKMPSNADEWLVVEEGFKDKFPHCVGCLDGKHIVMQAPFNSGSEYYNYKKSFSIVLLALVNSNYQFMFADIGSQGRISDGGVLMNSLLWKKICDHELHLPPDCPLPGSTTPLPYVILADGAFALSTTIMKPYPGNHEFGSKKRVFNRKLSSSRVKVENVFGIMASVFRIFRTPIVLQPPTVSLLTMTCVLLHNYLRTSRSSRSLYTPPGSFDHYDLEGNLIQAGSWRQEVDLNNTSLRNLQQTARRSKIAAQNVRDEFSNYFYNNR